MEISLFKFLFIMALVIYAASILYTKDKDFQLLLSIIAFILFSSLALLSLNIELYVYDGELWVSHRIEDYQLAFGSSFILAVLTGISIFVQLLELVRRLFTKKISYRMSYRDQL